MATGMSKANAHQGSHRKTQYAAYRSSNIQEGNKLKRIMRHCNKVMLSQQQSVLELANGKFKIGFISSTNKFVDCSDEFKIEVAAVNRIADVIGVAKTKSFVA